VYRFSGRAPRRRGSRAISRRHAESWGSRRFARPRPRGEAPRGRLGRRLGRPRAARRNAYAGSMRRFSPRTALRIALIVLAAAGAGCASIESPSAGALRLRLRDLSRRAGEPRRRARRRVREMGRPGSRIERAVRRAARGRRLDASVSHNAGIRGRRLRLGLRGPEDAAPGKRALPDQPVARILVRALEGRRAPAPLAPSAGRPPRLRPGLVRPPGRGLGGRRGTASCRRSRRGIRAGRLAGGSIFPGRYTAISGYGKFEFIDSYDFSGNSADNPCMVPLFGRSESI
jgi:hypothetical protein